MADKLHFAPDGTGHAIDFNSHGTHSLPKGSTSTLELRYILNDAGKVVDQYKDLDDEQAVLEHARLQEEERATIEAAQVQEQLIEASIMEPLDFMRKLTLEERISFRSSEDPVVIDFISMLEAAKTISVLHPDVQNALAYSASKGVLTSERAAELSDVQTYI